MNARALVAAASAAWLCGCVEKQPTGTENQVSSVVMTLRAPDPSQLGQPGNPILPPSSVTFDLTAVGDNGQPMGQDLDVDVYISFGGLKTGALTACGTDSPDKTPLERLHLPGGHVENHTLKIPPAYGATTLWIDEPVSHATGASPTFYFRNPFIADVQTPPDLTAANATFCSPFNGRFIVVDHPMGAAGKLVVSSVFGNAFSITDTTPGNFNSFNSMYIFSFGKPPLYIVPGKVVTKFSGNVSKFVGFTELNFPLFTVDQNADIAQLPPPMVIQTGDIATPAKLLPATAGVVTFTGQECDPNPPNPNHDPNIQKTDDSWLKYNQFVIDGNGTCDGFTNYAVELPSKTLGGFDPLKNVSKKLTVVGMLRNNSGQNAYADANGNPITCSPTNACAQGTCGPDGICKKAAYNFWTIVPRTPDDVTILP